MRILGIDFGQENLGVAISNEEGSLAQGLMVISKKEWEKRLPEIIRNYQVELVVVGLPKTMDNKSSGQTQKVLYFIERLKKLVICPITEWDERLSSKLAERYLLAADLSREKRKKVIDRLSAQIILQDYLDFRQKPDYPSKTAEEL